MKKKLLASLLAVCMFVGLAVPAFAEDGKTEPAEPTQEETETQPTIVQVDKTAISTTPKTVVETTDANGKAYVLGDASEFDSNANFKVKEIELPESENDKKVRVRVIGDNLENMQLFAFAAKSMPIDKTPTDAWWDITKGGWGESKGMLVKQIQGVLKSCGTFYINAPKGTYTFKLELYNVENEDDVVASTEEITVTVEEQTVTNPAVGTPVVTDNKIIVPTTKGTYDITKLEVDSIVYNKDKQKIHLDVDFNIEADITQEQIKTFKDTYGALVAVNKGEYSIEIVDYNKFAEAIANMDGVRDVEDKNPTKIHWYFVAHDTEGNVSGHMGLKDGTPATAVQIDMNVCKVESTPATVTVEGAGTQLANITPVIKDGLVTIDMTKATAQTGIDAAAQKYPGFKKGDKARTSWPVWLGLKLEIPAGATTGDLFNCTENSPDFYEDEIFYVAVGKKTTQDGKKSNEQSDYDKFVPLKENQDIEYVFTFSDGDKIISIQTLTVKVIAVEPKPTPTPSYPSYSSYNYVSNYTPHDVQVEDTNDTGVLVDVPKEVTNVTNPKLSTSELPDWSATATEFRAAADDYNIEKTFMIDLYDSTTKVTEVEGGKIEVSIPFAGDYSEDYVVLRYNDDKTVTELKATYADGRMSFETDHFSVYAIAVKDTNSASNSDATTATTVPMTSDTTPVSAVLLLAVMGGALALGRKKLCK